MVSVWVAATPPMLAINGINTAKKITSSIVSLKMFITEDAIIAVNRFIPNQNPLLFIADDVVLGKTIEAGLILRELLLRQKVQRIIVVPPPSDVPWYAICCPWVTVAT